MSDEESGMEFTGSSGDEGGDGGPCGNIVNSCAMMVVGMLLFPLSLYLLGWNEQSFVCENSRILFADSHVKNVGCNGKGITDEFVYLSCPVVPSSLETFSMCTFNRQHAMSCDTQPPFNFTSISGRQFVEMLLCQETCRTEKEKNSAGQNQKITTCSHSMTWSATIIDSHDFSKPLSDAEHGCPGITQAGGNPAAPSNLDMGMSTAYSTDVLVGDVNASYTLNRDLITQLAPNSPVSLKDVPWSVAGFKTAGYNEKPWTRPLTVSNDNLMHDDRYLRTCNDVVLGKGGLGCVRISFFRSDVTQPTVMTRVTSGGQTGKAKVPGSWGCSPSGWQAIVPTPMDQEGMVAHLQDMNRTRVWVLRIVGLFLCWMAIWCCLQPISAAAEMVGDCINLIPCGGYIEDLLTGLVDGVVCLLSCTVGLSTGLFVIAIVWLYMRPLIGGALLAVCVLLCCCAVGIRSMSSKRDRPPRKGTGGGFGGGFGGNAPVDPSLAQDFLEAARAEYVYGAPQAVQTFFDGQGVSPEEQEALQPFEDQIRDANNKNRAISRIQASWGLGSE